MHPAGYVRRRRPEINSDHGIQLDSSDPKDRKEQ